jgi:hypothetical protein
MHVARHLPGPDQDAVVEELPSQCPIETWMPAACHRGEEKAKGASIGDFDAATPLPAPRDVDHSRELEGWVEDEPSTIGHEVPRETLRRPGHLRRSRRYAVLALGSRHVAAEPSGRPAAKWPDRAGCPLRVDSGPALAPTRPARSTEGPAERGGTAGTHRMTLSGSRQEETIMAKKKTTTKAKMGSPKPRKQVKGRPARKSDPCEGGEVSRRR